MMPHGEYPYRRRETYKELVFRYSQYYECYLLLENGTIVMVCKPHDCKIKSCDGYKEYLKHLLEKL